MLWYVLKFGSVQLGDELVVPSSDWSSRMADLFASRSGLGGEDLPASSVQLLLKPSFHLRKTSLSMWHFEQWVFDLACWADGKLRQLELFDQQDNLVVDYGKCILQGVSRPQIQQHHSARYSNGVVLTFHASDFPQFYLD